MTTDTTPPTVLQSIQALDMARSFGRMFAQAEIVFSGLANANQVKDELDAAINSKRAELQQLQDQKVADLAAEQIAAVDAKVSEAKAKAQSHLDYILSQVEDAEGRLKTKTAELATVEEKLAGLKSSAKKIAG